MRHKRIDINVQRKASFLRYNKYQPQEAVFSVSDTGTFRRLDEAPPGSGRIAAAALEIATLPWHQRQFPGDCVRAGTHRDRKTDRSAADDGGGKFARSATPMGSTTKLVGDKTPDEKVPWFKLVPGLATTLLTLSLTASVGNHLRLPRIAYQNGGGSFLVAYAIITVFLGLPLAFLEIVLGQFGQQGTTKLWRAVPLFRGVGFVKVMVSQLLAVYYPVLMGISLFYAAWSAKGPLPFSECVNPSAQRPFISNNSPKIANGELCLQNTFIKPVDQNAMWFGVNVALLFLIWTVLLLCVFKNAQSYRKSMYFIMIPTIVIFVAIIWEQVKRGPYNLSPLLNINWKALLSFDVWYAALIQFFFSTHIGFGNITTGAGVLFSKSSAFWTAVFYIFMNLFVGLLFVFNVYSWIENLETAGYIIPENIKIPETFVLTIMYDSISRTYDTLTQFWATIAFLLIVLAGFASTVSLVFTVVTALSVETKNKWKWWVITSGVCLLSFFASIFCLLRENLKIVHILDAYVIGRIVVLSTILELVGFIYIYGLEPLSNDFEFVLGYRLCFLWKIFWFIAPIFLTIVEGWSLVTTLLNLNQDGAESWMQHIGWGFYVLAWLVIIITALWQICNQVDYNLSQKSRSALKPSRNWGPVDPIYRHCWVQWKKQYQITGERDFTLKRRGTRDYTHSVKRSHSRPGNGAYGTNTSSLKGTHSGRVNSAYSVEPVSIRRNHGKKINSAYSIDPATATLRSSRSRSFHYNGDLESYEQTIKSNNHRYTLDSYFPNDTINIHDYVKAELKAEKEPEFTTTYVYTPTQNLSAKYTPPDNNDHTQKRIKTKHSFHEADIDNTTYGRIKIKQHPHSQPPDVRKDPPRHADEVPYPNVKHTRPRETSPGMSHYSVQPKPSFRYDPNDDAQLYYVRQNYRGEVPSNVKPKSHSRHSHTQQPCIFQEGDDVDHVFWRKEISPYTHYM
ncbi:sodium-dependent nutrient amino acid transporter 1 isoform X3 [Bemisia tabaci]|uniref:sodium-dependent nutrient amino acid transporter 1 isoform X3 n=1 Tax=Bemisia tabaci TaxID=7038 RepID=UPI003B284A07